MRKGCRNDYLEAFGAVYWAKKAVLKNLGVATTPLRTTRVKQVIAILSNLTPITAVILEFQLIRLSNKICFGQIGFLDPQNMGVDTKITILR